MKNFRIIDGQIYAGSSPSPKDLEYLKNILHIKTIISLDEDEGNRLKQELKDLDIKQFIIPLDSKTYIDQYLRYLIQHLKVLAQNNQPVYIHCLHGQDRTGFAEAIYHMTKQNWNINQAISKVKQYGFGTGISQNTKNFWLNILRLLDQDENLDDKNAQNEYEDIALAEDFFLQELRDTFRMDEMGLPQQYQRFMFGPTENSPPSMGYFSRSQRLSDLKDKYISVPQVGLNPGLGPTRGFGPVDTGVIFEYP